MSLIIRKQVREMFEEYLNKGNHRKTQERFEILDKIYTIKGHFDMDTLHNALTKDSFIVSRATLYNNMELFVDSGLVIKHQFGDLAAQYEKSYGNDNHDHLICISCGSVRECKNLGVVDQLEKKKIRKFKVKYYSLYIYGVCPKCDKKRQLSEKKK